MRDHKIDERKDKIRRIKEVIENTQDNIEFANDMLVASADERRKQLKAQNERRGNYVDTLQNELKEKLGKEKKQKK